MRFSPFEKPEQLVLILALTLLAVAIAGAANTYMWLANAKRATGDVVLVESNLQSYRTTIRFITETGEQKYVRTSFIQPQLGKVGDHQEVAYVEGQEFKAEVLAFQTLWLIPSVLAFSGGILLYLCIRLCVLTRRRKGFARYCKR